MNILGEGFPDEIIKQVEQRQKVYGSGYNSLNPRTPEEIIYLNANTSWVKLASSVDIKNIDLVNSQAIKDLKLKDGELAKKFVLFNGTDAPYDPYLRAGISNTNNLIGDSSAYGIGGTEFGLRPMMGIISADIKHENRGSIRRATIQVKAFNKVQFDIIDVLYLRLGFNVLLEWGHSMYFDNNGVLQKGTDNDNSLIDKFLNPSSTPIFTPGLLGNVIGGTTSAATSLTYVDFLNLIDSKRKTSNGNYDAMFGKVCNFHWSFLPDGSYDITIELVSIGDIIESFKINALISGFDASTKAVKKGDKDPSQMSSSDLITLYANQSEIGTKFWELTGGIITSIKEQEDKDARDIGKKREAGGI
jgi:hypothetical protein